VSAAAAQVRRALIDTDPGIDDLLALAFAAASPELRIAAITTVAGNAPLSAVHENAARFCSLAGIEVPLVTVMASLDNLGKGAAGQAVQNMNLMLGFEPAAGLRC